MTTHHVSEDLIEEIAQQHHVGVMQLNGDLYAVIRKPGGRSVTFTTANLPTQRVAGEES